jgi:hypothetical protein
MTANVESPKLFLIDDDLVAAERFRRFTTDGHNNSRALRSRLVKDIF